MSSLRYTWLICDSPTPQTPPAEPKTKAPESYQPFTLPAEMPAEDPQVKAALDEAGGLNNY